MALYEMFPTTGKEFTRRMPDDFVPRSFFSGNSEERSEPGSGSSHGAGAAAAAPRARGRPRGSPPLGGLAVPALFPRWKSRDGGSQPRGGSKFPWPPSGSVNSASSSAPFTPRGHICAHSVGQPSARVCADGSRAHLPGGVWKPKGSKHTSWKARAGGERGLRCSSGGSGVVCSSSVRVCFLLCLRRPRWMRCDPGVQAWAVQIKSS